jgi:hypothetical protein
MTDVAKLRRQIGSALATLRASMSDAISASIHLERIEQALAKAEPEPEETLPAAMTEARIAGIRAHLQRVDSGRGGPPAIGTPSADARELLAEVDRMRAAAAIDPATLLTWRAMVTNWLTVDELTISPASEPAHMVLLLLDVVDAVAGRDNAEHQRALYDTFAVPLAERTRAAMMRLRGGKPEEVESDADV